jgi:two-component system, OmpR family, phosphate regulon response regulator PhoB
MARVLVVDDDFVWRSLYRLELGADHEIVEAADAGQALAALQDQVPDLILLDYHLPGMSGGALLRLLRARGVRVPVILCTADPRLAARAAPDAVVSKQTDLRQLRRTIGSVLAAQHASDPGRAA